MWIDDARKMGCRAVYADTFRRNRPVLEIHEQFSFRYIPRYRENGNPEDDQPFLVYLEFRSEQDGNGHSASV